MFYFYNQLIPSELCFIFIKEYKTHLIVLFLIVNINNINPYLHILNIDLKQLFNIDGRLRLLLLDDLSINYIFRTNFKIKSFIINFYNCNYCFKSKFAFIINIAFILI